MLFTNSSFDNRNFAKDPAVVKVGGTYLLYHSTERKVGNKMMLGIGIAKSTDLENWQVVGDVPATEKCERKGIGAPGAIVLNGKVHLFYQTYGNKKRDAICHAVSCDGINFEKDPCNPIYSPSKKWCCGRAIDADVCVYHDRLMLYVATRDKGYKVQMIGGASAPLDSKLSKGDFVELCASAMLKPELKWEGKCIEAPATIVYNDKIFMFYGGAYNCSPQQIGVAVSCDGVHFERVFDHPFVPVGTQGEFNSSESGHPFVFVDDDGRVYLFYQGSPDDGISWYLSKIEIAFDGDIPKILK